MKTVEIKINYPGEREIAFTWSFPNHVILSEMLEAVFHMFNGGSGREHPLFLENKTMRSLSVNDFVCIDGQWFQCKSFDWAMVTAKRVIQVNEQIAKEIQVDQKRDPWSVLNDVMYKQTGKRI